MNVERSVCAYAPGEWWSEFYQLTLMADLLDALVSDKEVVESIVEKYYAERYEATGPQFEWEDKWLIEFNLVQIQEKFFQQSIVLMVSYLDALVEEFLACWFYSHPDTMYDYLTVQKDMIEVRGVVRLNEITSFGDITRVLENLAWRAAAKVGKRKIGKRIEVIERLTKIEMPSSVKETLVALVELRNHIVHEYVPSTEENLSLDSIRAVSEEISEFIDRLDAIWESLEVE